MGSMEFGVLHNSQKMLELPNYSNEKTRRTEEMLGPFDYESFQPQNLKNDLVNDQPIRLASGSVYYGQRT